MTHTRSLILRLGIAIALTALAANCFLKYLWWTACYSAWSGIPKMAAQWRAAGTNASFNGWGFLVLEVAAIAVLFSVITLRSATGVFQNALRLVASLTLAIASTTVFTLIISWVKQTIP